MARKRRRCGALAAKLRRVEGLSWRGAAASDAIGRTGDEAWAAPGRSPRANERGHKGDADDPRRSHAQRAGATAAAREASRRQTATTSTGGPRSLAATATIAAPHLG